ncbi:MAG: DUF4845 domain-containing protein [Gammaproteobacteria bacterium]
MMFNPKQQQGMTMIGWIIVLGLIAFFVTVALRLVPVYMEYSKVASVLDATATETGIASKGKKEILLLLGKRFRINDVKTVSAKDVKISKNGPKLDFHLAYERREPFIGNVDIIASFDKTVTSN